MLLDCLLPDPAQVHLLSMSSDADMLYLELQAHADTAGCPVCGPLSRRVHSHYLRRPQDLPWAGRPVRLRLRVRRFRCLNPACRRRLFTERLPSLIRPSARATLRCEAALRALVLAVGGEGGARLSQLLGLNSSPDRLLRVAHQTPLPPRPTPRVLGLDEWAWRKRRRYGTILVDLETHHVVDLLPDARRASVTAWLRAHPGIAVISRDRSGPFALAATEGAPHAQQVADRFHLPQNVAQVLQRVLERHSQQVEALRLQREAPSEAETAGTAGGPPAGESPPAPAPAGWEPGATVPLRRADRQAQYAEARRLYHLGWRKQAIAAHLGVVPETVRRWLRSEIYEARAGGKGRGRGLGSKVDHYAPYVQQRWAEGGQNGRILYQELVAQGYTGSYSLLRKWLVDRRVHEPGAPLTPPRPKRHSIPDLVFCVLRRAEERSAAEEHLATALSGLAGPGGQSCALSQAFAQLVREQHAAGLDAWLATASANESAEWATFVNGVRRDEAAVRAALSEPWNQGPVEGHIHRLKLIKRAMVRRVTRGSIAPAGSQD